jgi:hypothetical protein
MPPGGTGVTVNDEEFERRAQRAALWFIIVVLLAADGHRHRVPTTAASQCFAAPRATGRTQLAPTSPTRVRLLTSVTSRSSATIRA